MRIVSDGTPMGTHVYDSTGKDLTATEKITHIAWSISSLDRGSCSRVSIEFLVPDIDIEVDDEDVTKVPMRTGGAPGVYVSE